MKETLKQMFEARLHLGHLSKSWNPKTKPYIREKRNKQYFIDLVQTYFELKKVVKFLEISASQGKNILFVGTKRQATDLIAKAASESNSFFINERWLGGMLTNWKTIYGSIKKLQDLEKKEESGEFEILEKKVAASYRKRKEKLERYVGGVKKMKWRPDIVIIIGQVEEMNAVKECRKLGIKIITILDTNCNPTLADYFVPANDDSRSSLKFLLNYFKKAIIQGQQNKTLKTGLTVKSQKNLNFRKTEKIKTFFKEKN